MAETPGDPQAYYERHVFICMNQRDEGHPRGCCADKGADDVRGYMRAKAKQLGIERIRINSSGCLDRCEIGPNMVIYPEGVWYRCTTFEDVDEVLQKHLIEGGRVERLMLKPEDGAEA